MFAALSFLYNSRPQADVFQPLVEQPFLAVLFHWLPRGCTGPSAMIAVHTACPSSAAQALLSVRDLLHIAIDPFIAVFSIGPTP
jgi:hypothetical protein